MPAGRLQAQCLADRRCAKNDKVGFAARTDPIVREPRGAGCVHRDHVHHLLQLLGQRELRGVRHHERDFELVRFSEGIIGIIHIVLR